MGCVNSKGAPIDPLRRDVENYCRSEWGFAAQPADISAFSERFVNECPRADVGALRTMVLCSVPCSLRGAFCEPIFECA